MQDQDQDQFFWSKTGLVLRPTVSDHIAVEVSKSVSLLYVYFLSVLISNSDLANDETGVANDVI